MLKKKIVITERLIEINHIAEIYGYKLPNNQWSNTNKENTKPENKCTSWQSRTG